MEQTNSLIRYYIENKTDNADGRINAMKIGIILNTLYIKMIIGIK